MIAYRLIVNRSILTISLLIGLLLLGNCGKKPVNQPVAKIGGRVITADEFAFAYEMAPRAITSREKSQARRLILDQMIAKIVLAHQAEKEGLGNDTLLQKTVDLYRRLAINRELYLKHVRQPIKVSETEERQAFEYSKTTLFVRHFSSEQADLAIQVSAGIMPLRHTPMYTGAHKVKLPGYGIVDEIKWRDIPEEVANIVYTLSPKEYSKPYFDGQRYHVFQVVEIVREALIRENDFQATRESLYGILKKRKEQKASSEYVQKIMADQRVTIRADALNKLTEEVWKKRPTATAPLEQYITNQEINSLTRASQAFLNTEIAGFSSGSMSVADILVNYKVNPVKISYQNKIAVRESLKNAVGMYVRDWVLSEQGTKEHLDRKPSVIAEERSRREHLLMRKMLAQIGRDYDSQYPDSTVARTKLEQYIANYIAKIRSTEYVKIYSDNLLAIKTTDTGLARKIDFVAFHTQ